MKKLSSKRKQLSGKLSSKKEIRTVCLPCGGARDKKHKQVMGVWKDTCDICGEENIPCADAAHDFGIYSNKEIKAKDKVNDLI